MRRLWAGRLAREPVTLAFFALWLGSMMWLAIAQHQIAAVSIVLIAATSWTASQVLGRSIRTTEPGRQSSS